MPPQEEIWSQARRLAQPWMSMLAETDLTASAALDLLRGEDLGYRMTNFFADWRRYKGIGIQKPYVQKLDPTSSVPRSWMIETPSEVWHIPEPHKGVFTGTMLNIDTGLIETKIYDVGFDREISKSEAETYLEEVIPWEISDPGYEMVGVELIGWKHKAGEMY